MDTYASNRRIEYRNQKQTCPEQGRRIRNPNIECSKHYSIRGSCRGTGRTWRLTVHKIRIIIGLF